MIISPTEKLIGWLSSTHCSICNLEGSSWCQACQETTCPQPILRCFKCNKLTSQNMVCNLCSRSYDLDELYFGGYYDKLLKKLINDYKFNGRRSLAESFASLLDSRLPYLPANTIVTFVPTIAPHVRRRGMDQAERLAWQLAKTRSFEFSELLGRNDRHQQHGQTRAVRLKQLKGVFYPTHRVPSLGGKTILLVDDVMTTGATLQTAAKVLKQIGAQTVIGVALAHGNMDY